MRGGVKVDARVRFEEIYEFTKECGMTLKQKEKEIVKLFGFGMAKEDIAERMLVSVWLVDQILELARTKGEIS